MKQWLKLRHSVIASGSKLLIIDGASGVYYLDSLYCQAKRLYGMYGATVDPNH